ncbi:hypothetical protein Tco_0491904 [Tanacetum coccineum]
MIIGLSVPSSSLRGGKDIAISGEKLWVISGLRFRSSVLRAGHTSPRRTEMPDPCCERYFFLHMSKADRDHLHRCLISAVLLVFPWSPSLPSLYEYWIVALEGVCLCWTSSITLSTSHIFLCYYGISPMTYLNARHVTGSIFPEFSNTPPSFRGLGCGEGDLFFLSLLNTLACGDGLGIPALRP